ncbi:MAG: DEAD/DEAH box helicase [Casimicrobiaceae bacterium]
MTAAAFHPAVDSWFRSHFREPTEAQARAWPLIQRGRNVLVAAPTGSGKTLAAFLAAIDSLVQQGIEAPLPDETFVVYVSPLKALSNDIQKNLAAPIAGIRAALAARGDPDVPIRTLVRTGDTPQAERASMRKRPPHIVVTTPESLYVLLGSESGRRMLATTRTVIVDEIHALAGNKRGSHLALSLERLAAIAARPPSRVGLSATQKPIEEVARFLVGTRAAEDACAIVDTGHVRPRDLALDVPSSPLSAVMSTDVWKEVYARLALLAQDHRTTLVFVNTRRMAERAARHLSELLGPEQVTAHHGSMAKELRLAAEQRLKRGELKVLVATASLELGIDIGDVELVCQLGSPRAISTFLQRAGRAAHQVDGVPKARLFPLSRDELVECTALLDAVARGELDRLAIPVAPLDVLAQQIVAEVAAQDWEEAALYELVRRAYPYCDLTVETYREVVRMLADGFSTRQGHRGTYVHRDAVHGRLRGRRGARMTALTSGGAIPDNADYDVVLEPAGQLVGTVNEDFAVESIAGDIFQLGNASYRIQRVEAGRVRVEDAHGLPPTIPFWLGEAPGRSDELSAAVSRLRADVAAALEHGPSGTDVARGLAATRDANPAATSQLVEYLATARAALGVLPTQDTIVLERFFDESGGMQLVIHAPFGSRINRAWGLALRKRFCLKFDFELQAAATEDAIVLSLSTSHSFALDEVPRYLHSSSVREVLAQAVLTAPMFTARWRWIATTSLALPRFRGGKKVPAPLQRMRAEDLVAAVFPDQIACAENVAGAREVPDHPLVRQALHDCLNEAMDVEGLETLLRRIESGACRVVTRELTMPSPLAMEILNARPYAYLDDAPLEERRTQAVMARRWLDTASAADLGSLDMAAIERVRADAWPVATNADELHDALCGAGLLTVAEVRAGPGWTQWLEALAADGRATCVAMQGPTEGVWVAAERLPVVGTVHSGAARVPPVEPPLEYAARDWTRDSALVELVRSRMQILGPATPQDVATGLGVAAAEVEAALAVLAREGVVMEGRFTPGAGIQWCDRALLARIHRATIERLRKEIEPVATQDFMRFLMHWQHVLPETRRQGPDALAAVIADLQGFEAPAAAWESEILPARLEDYEFTWLDDLCLSGRAVWTRLTVPAQAGMSAGPIRSTPIALLPRRSAPVWMRLAIEVDRPAPMLSSRGESVRAYLAAHGASFFDEITDGVRMLRSHVEDALAELVATGLVTSDSFAGLRALLTPSEKRKPFGGKRRRKALMGVEDAGRWTLVRRPVRVLHADGADATRPAGATETLHPPVALRGRALESPQSPEGRDPIEPVVEALLRRYGVVFWRLLERESTWLPRWRDLLRVLRRLEARGEVRGGRFVAGISGEQFALPDAVTRLRETRRCGPTGVLVSLSGADPLNLIGIVLPGARVPALAGNRVLFRDGLPIAALAGGEVRWLTELDVAARRTAEDILVRRQPGSPLLAYLR